MRYNNIIKGKGGDAVESKQETKKDRNDKHTALETIVFITAILNLIEAVIDLIKDIF